MARAASVSAGADWTLARDDSRSLGLTLEKTVAYACAKQA
jgi:hypothetical protein